MLADFLGFGGALGIQVVVAGLQSDHTDQLPGTGRANSTTEAQIQVPVSDSLLVSEFLHHRMVSVVIILLASLSQGAASQLSSHVLTVAGIRTRNALQVNIDSSEWNSLIGPDLSDTGLSLVYISRILASKS